MKPIFPSAGILSFVLLAPCAAMFLLWLSAVEVTPTEQDIAAIHTVFGDLSCAGLDDFDAQVVCIKALQVNLKARIPNMHCADRGVLIEPSDFIERNYGCCFDRARLLEKTLTYMGYEVRRLALFDATKYKKLSLIIPGVTSHATLEVLTKKGWMGVDSNELFVLMDIHHNPLTYRDIPVSKNDLLEQPSPSAFYQTELIGVYGMYSRHGLSHKPMVLAPEINWGQFFKYNFK